MPLRKPTRKYYFSVEGETEQWYLKWLEDTINQTDEAECKVSFDCPVEKNPLKRVKKLTITSKVVIYHITDYESNEPIHTKEFRETIDSMSNAEKLGKDVTYKLGYTNLTFELWILLHKTNCNTCLAHRKNYLKLINSAYGERFANMDEYKHESNFKRCLSTLTISDVNQAIDRAKDIMKKNKENGLVLHQYRKCKYYEENPSLMIWEPIEQILLDCKLR